MDYRRIYYQLIEKRQQILVEGYSEKHHILPKCLKGTNNTENLVRLSAREHFIAHQLLVKMYPKVNRLIRALNLMMYCNQQKYTSRQFEWIKIMYRENNSGKNNSFYGKKHTEENRIKCGAKNRGKKASKETIGKLKLRKNHNTPHCEEVKLKISEAVKNLPKVKCPHCNKEGGQSAMKRWHFDRCRFRVN